jgi:predicted amino acid racemase
MYPRLIVDIEKIRRNTFLLTELCKNHAIEVAGVTKVFCGDPIIAKAYIDGGVKYLADSRVENLKKMRDLSLPKLMLRLPMLSEVKEIVRYADLSLNSEWKTICFLDREARRQKTTHGIILMIDLGDLREGIIDLKEAHELVGKIRALEHVKLEGIGTNLTCYGGILPTKENLERLVMIRDQLVHQYGIDLPVLSGGNSSSLYLLDDDKMPTAINMLRIGEGIVLGRETAFGKPIEGAFDDGFVLELELIEVRDKPSFPIGEVGLDAFGNKPEFEDKGPMRRGICAAGRQDVSIEGLLPEDSEISIIGASSDHLIVDLSKRTQYVVGDVLRFKLTYGGLLAACTSPYVAREYTNKTIE